jgi:hypothetical protein
VTERLHLGFGWGRGLVPGIKAAWGARWIVTQNGGVDMLHDRQDAEGDPDLLRRTLDWLNSPLPSTYEEKTVLRRAQAVASEGLRNMVINTREAGGVVLHQDDKGAVIANTNASHGYLYVAAFLFDSLPDGHPTLGLEIALGLEEPRG